MSYSGQLVAERYRLTSLIGSGGMGRVWLARDQVLHRDVAVKEVVFPEDMSVEDRSELFQRTMREARAAGRLSHPNVVAVYDVLQDEGRPWIVMELIKSRSLYQVIKEDGPIPPRQAAQIGLAVLAALRTAHRAGVFHRDVKPGNVLLGEDGRVVLTDFGLATFEGDGTVTRSGVILGSAQYISPERARDGAFGPESDLWSLGATLYAAVEGRSPYARDTPMATLTALATVPPDPPRRAGPLRQVLIGLLRKNPRQRMKAGEVERLLTRVAAVAVAVGAAVYLRTPVAGTSSVAPTGAASRSAAPIAPALTAAMGIQACANQTADHETTVRLGPGLTSALDNWTPFVDRSGFALNVPVGWGQSRIGGLLCFRDPDSLKTIAVYDHGRLEGNLVQLVDDTAAWRAAAALDDYRRLAVRDMHLPEGGAVLEYTYRRGTTTMHGQNWMMRLGGRVFTVSLLASDGAWAVDRDFLVAAFASFRVVTAE